MRPVLLTCTAIAVGILAGCSDEPDAGPAGDAPAVAAETSATPSRSGPPAAKGDGSVPIEITAVVGGRTYSVAGNGQCTHTDDASIYGVRAAQWRASYSAQAGDLRSLSLTIWQPASGGDDQANLAIRVGETTYRVATVTGGDIIGSGIASASRSGDAGTLTVDGRDGEGTPVRVSVDCGRFDVPVAEGG